MVVAVVAAGVAPAVAGGAAPVVAGGVAPVVAGGVAPVVERVAPPTLDAPVVGVVEVGRVIIGVGSGGNGLDNTLAIISFRPASD